MSGIFDQVINYAPPSLLLGTVTYKGTWSAATNTPTLANPPSSITNGNYYVVSAAGTQFSLSFNIGDWIISNGSAWEKVDNTDAVSSVFGRMGAVVGVSTDYSVVGITNTALGASNPSTVAATTITATSTIAATGAVTGSNLSGTNTGDQTISLTGGVTGSGTGSFAATVVTNANLTGVITSVGNATSIASQTGTGSTFVVSGSPTITTPVIAQINDASGNETLKLASIASAVNEVTIENAATGNAVHISATGGDASVGLHLAGKGASGYVNVQDSVDATKRIMFNASGGTTNTRTMLSSTQTVDRTLSLPDATDTLVGVAATQTLSNKTITGGILNGSLGLTTPSTVAATTVTATGTISSTVGNAGTAFDSQSATTGYIHGVHIKNTSGELYLGLEGTTAGTLITGDSAYDTTVRSLTPISFSANGGSALQARISSTGLAVTGTLSATGAINTPASSIYGGGSYMEMTATVSDTTKVVALAGAGGIRCDVSGTTRSLLTATGLAVTGTLSATGNTSTGGTLSNAVGWNNISQVIAATSVATSLRTTTGTIRQIDISLQNDNNWRVFDAIASADRLSHNGTTFAVTGALSVSAQTTLAGAVQITTTSFPSTGAGLELSYNGNISFVQSYNRTGSAYTPLYLIGSNIQIAPNGSNAGIFSSTGLAVTGLISATTTVTATTEFHAVSAANTGSASFRSAFTTCGVDLANSLDTSGVAFINFRKADSTAIGSINRVALTNAVVYNTTSDARLKENFRDFTDSGRLIDALKPRVFDWKDSGGNGKDVIGFVAQEEHAADPVFAHIGAVSVGDDDPTTITKQWQRSDAALIPILVAELQSLRKRLAALEA